MLLAGSLQTASAFSMLGIREPYQVIELSYIGDFSFTPKNLGEEFRWNTPVLYYAFDSNFLDYFGSNGVHAVEQAVAIMNALTNVSHYSADLSEFPLESQRLNFTASALHLFDLKSAALEILVERMGLTDPEEFTWTLRNRALPPGATCPNYVYTVIKRNFDPITLAPSSYVNGNLYSYVIFEFCPTPNQADAVEFLVDPLAMYSSAVASPKMSVANTAYYGYFYTGLTRDDVGGLRYLMRTNNMNVEPAASDALLIHTNTATSQLLVTSNLNLLVAQSFTNSAAELEALYPGLVVAGTTNFYTNVVTTNVTAYFTNHPWQPVGSFASIAFITNRITNVVVQFRHNFANVVTNTYSTTGIIRLLTTNISSQACQTSPWLPPPPPETVCTNITVSPPLLVNMIAGDFYIIPTNLCGVSIIATQLVSVIPQTNLVVVLTNDFGVTNAGPQEYSESIITYFTNRAFIIHPVVCQTNTVALRQGIEKVTFVRRDYDSLLGRFFAPITNTYRITAVTNSVPTVQTLRRVVTEPDILFSAADIVTGPTGWPIIIPTVSRQVPNFSVATNAPNQLLGPGIIQPTVQFEFNKVGPIFINSNPFFIDEATAELDFIWASFDGSTNAPVIYPIGTSITNLENQVLIQISPRYLPDGEIDVFYEAEIESQSFSPAWQAPYTWDLAPGSPGLPPGLSIITEDGKALIFGTPTEEGHFDFVVRATDALGRTRDQSYSIQINP